MIYDDTLAEMYCKEEPIYYLKEKSAIEYICSQITHFQYFDDIDEYEICKSMKEPDKIIEKYFADDPCKISYEIEKIEVYDN